jgi:hypothetical protein
MARNDRFGHTADGQQPADRAVAHGYAFCIIAENIGEFRAPGMDTGALAEQLVRGWQRSPEHRENLLDTDVTDTGAGVARNAATGSYVAVQLFGLPKSASITFSLANRTDGAVAYRIGGDRFTLPPATIRTHETCGAAPLALDGGPPRGRTPVDGEQLAVVRAPDGTLALQPQAR